MGNCHSFTKTIFLMLTCVTLAIILLRIYVRGEERIPNTPVTLQGGHEDTFEETFLDGLQQTSLGPLNSKEKRLFLPASS